MGNITVGSLVRFNSDVQAGILNRVLRVKCMNEHGFFVLHDLKNKDLLIRWFCDLELYKEG